MLRPSRLKALVTATRESSKPNQINSHAPRPRLKSHQSPCQDMTQTSQSLNQVMALELRFFSHVINFGHLSDDQVSFWSSSNSLGLSHVVNSDDSFDDHVSFWSRQTCCQASQCSQFQQPMQWLSHSGHIKSIMEAPQYCRRIFRRLPLRPTPH